MYLCISSKPSHLSQFLFSLISEQQVLEDKVKRITDLIAVYTAESISSPVSHSKQEPPISSLPSISKQPALSIITSDGYPTSGQWAEKIQFVLKQIGKPATAREVASFLQTAEASEDDIHIRRTATIYLSNLGISGDVSVSKQGHRNFYFLKS